MPELPEVEAWRRALDPDVQRSPIEKAGPAHIATLKTFDPPLHALDTGTTPNGVYAYSSTPTLPTGSWNATNYWVDLLFSPTP